jgi:hypothetical protein
MNTTQSKRQCLRDLLHPAVSRAPWAAGSSRRKEICSSAAPMSAAQDVLSSSGASQPQAGSSVERQAGDVQLSWVHAICGQAKKNGKFLVLCKSSRRSFSDAGICQWQNSGHAGRALFKGALPYPGIWPVLRVFGSK